jgi:hypothetical protein
MGEVSDARRTIAAASLLPTIMTVHPQASRHAQGLAPATNWDALRSPRLGQRLPGHAPALALNPNAMVPVLRMGLRGLGVEHHLPLSAARNMTLGGDLQGRARGTVDGLAGHRAQQQLAHTFMSLAPGPQHQDPASQAACPADVA